jgi:hypothetical protein
VDILDVNFVVVPSFEGGARQAPMASITLNAPLSATQSAVTLSRRPLGIHYARRSKLAAAHRNLGRCEVGVLVASRGGVARDGETALIGNDDRLGPIL